MSNDLHTAPTKKSEQKRVAIEERARQLKDQRQRQQRRSRLVKAAWITASVLAVALVTTLIVSTALSGMSNETANPASPDGASLVGRSAPDFTMPDTSGQEVSLASFRGSSAVILYFSEGAGCEACIVQMKAIEQKQAEFSKAGFTVLPIVMNTSAQIEADTASYAVKTPFLIDGGTASAVYGTLGKGMHEGMPGHSFVVVDKDGVVRWSGDYPSMWLDPSELLSKASDAIK